MDGSRFDALAKSLTARPDRRFALRLLAGMTLAAGMARHGPTEAKKGRKRRRRKTCKGGTVTCGKACIADDDCCVAGQRVPRGDHYRQCGLCQSGRVVFDDAPCRAIDPQGCTVCDPDSYSCQPLSVGIACRPGFSECGICRDGLCDPDEGRPCGPTCCSDLEECCQDNCRIPCPAGQVRDPTTCGCTCGGRVCEGGETCEDGLCRSQRCPAPDWYACGATCCWSGTGGTYLCCHGANGIDYCCDPGLQCSTGSAGCQNPGS